MKTWQIILLCCFSATFSQCYLDEIVWMEYHETSCSDAWQKYYYPGSANINIPKSEVIRVVDNYLELENIQVIRIYMETKLCLAEDCEACSCTTGRVINVRIMDYDINKMLDLGFEQR